MATNGSLGFSRSMILCGQSSGWKDIWSFLVFEPRLFGLVLKHFITLWSYFCVEKSRSLNHKIPILHRRICLRKNFKYFKYHLQWQHLLQEENFNQRTKLITQTFSFLSLYEALLIILSVLYLKNQKLNQISNRKIVNQKWLQHLS